MAHSTSLRAIGQSLEILGVDTFVIEKDGPRYVVRSDSLPAGSELVFKPTAAGADWESPAPARAAERTEELRYDPIYIAWLNAQGRKKRRKRFSSQILGTRRLSQLLRTLGKHLDRVDVATLKIAWAPASVRVEYDTAEGERYQETLTPDELSDLGLRMRFRRARRRS
ncbi:MAG TPA: hypothetical protein VNN77_18150 [candidate division Zixibacteria bacterium]|nr:hypothetical protein [candidate division Zixibacteria bacterium]